jgi:hypothetical protein
MLSAPQLKSLMEHVNTLWLCWGMQKLMGENLKVVFGTGFNETMCLAVLLSSHSTQMLLELKTWPRFSSINYSLSLDIPIL